MNRPIKFRIWHKDLKKMLYPPYGMDSMPYLRDSAGNHVYIPQGGKIRKDGPTPMYPLTNTITTNGLYYINGMLQDIELMQFTGLKDDNDKDIYEGDVVEWDNNLDQDGIREHYSVIIKWDEDKARFFGECPFSLEKYDMTDFGFLQYVSGNIYENPEWVINDSELDNFPPDFPEIPPPW